MLACWFGFWSSIRCPWLVFQNWWAQASEVGARSQARQVPVDQCHVGLPAGGGFEQAGGGRAVADDLNAGFVAQEQTDGRTDMGIIVGEKQFQRVFRMHLAGVVKPPPGGEF